MRYAVVIEKAGANCVCCVLGLLILAGVTAQYAVAETASADQAKIGKKGAMACYAKYALEMFLSDRAAFAARIRHDKGALGDWYVSKTDGTVCYRLEAGTPVKVLEEQPLSLPAPNSTATVIMPGGLFMPILVRSGEIVRER